MANTVDTTAIPEIDAALAHTTKAATNAPEGWVLVPRRPTREMLHVMRYGRHDAKLIAIDQTPEPGETPWPSFGEPRARQAYLDALAVAPAAPAAEPDAAGREAGAAEMRERCILAIGASLDQWKPHVDGGSSVAPQEAEGAVVALRAVRAAIRSLPLHPGLRALHGRGRCRIRR